MAPTNVQFTTKVISVPSEVHLTVNHSVEEIGVSKLGYSDFSFPIEPDTYIHT